MLVSTWQHDVLETLNPGQERKIHGDFSVDVVDRFLEEKKKKLKNVFTIGSWVLNQVQN